MRSLRSAATPACRRTRPRPPAPPPTVPAWGDAAGVRSAAAVLASAVLRRCSWRRPGRAADPPRPTVDPSAPTPTSPYPGRPPQGHAPDGRTVGGEELDTRGLVVADGAPPLPDGLTAAGWLVADAGTGDVLAARDPHGRYYPASTLKTLTLLTLAPLLDPARVVVGTAEDENIEGSRVGLVAGGQYPVSLLFQALILQSGNDAANALARAAGGVDVTVAAMNETARGHRRLRHGGRDAVRARRRRAVLLPLRPRADLPRADLRPGDRRGAGHARPPRCRRSRAARPATRSRARTRCCTTYPGRPRREDRLHRRRPAHLRHRRRARRPPAGGQRHGHREHARCAPPTRRPGCSTGGSPSPPAPTGVGTLVAPGDPRRRRRPRRHGAAPAAPPQPAATDAASPAPASGFPVVPVTLRHRRPDRRRGARRPSRAVPTVPGTPDGPRVRRPPARRPPGSRDTASTRRRVAVHAAVKKAKRATRLIQTSRPTAPPNADAVTLPEIRVR